MEFHLPVGDFTKMAHMKYIREIINSQNIIGDYCLDWLQYFYSTKGPSRYAVPTDLVHASGLDMTLAVVVNNIPRRLQYAREHIAYIV